MGLYSLIAGILLVKFFQEIASILISTIAADLSVAAPSIQIGLSLQSAGYAITSFLLIKFNDKIGSLRVMMISVFIMLISSIVLVVTSHPLAMQISRFFLGLSMGGLNCSSFVQIRRITSNESLARTLSTTNVILFSSATIYSLIAEHFKQWWRQFFVIGAITAAILLTRVIKAQKQDNTYPAHDIKLIDLKESFSNADIVRCCIVTCLTLGHTYGLQSLAAAYRQNVCSFNQGLVQFSGRIFMTAGAWLFGFWRFNVINVARAGSIAITLSLLMMLADLRLQTTALFIAGFIATYFTMGITQTALKTELFILLDHLPSLAQGLISGLGLLWDGLTGALIWQIPWPIGPYCFGALTIICTVLVVILAELTKGLKSS